MFNQCNQFITKFANMSDEEQKKFIDAIAEKERREQEARAKDWEEYKKTVPEIPLVHKKEYYGDNVAEVTTIVRNRYGIYPGRNATLLTQTANGFNSKIQFKAKGKTQDAKSILMWPGSGLQRGDEVTISATGSDACKAVKALVELIDSKFGEE